MRKIRYVLAAAALALSAAAATGAAVPASASVTGAVPAMYFNE